ncbi:hypothetical protein Tco_1424650 [Tanacetum coccineum]
MTTLKFVDTYNMVAFFSIPAKSEGFEQIVDFMNAIPIKYALTINPTIHALCIEHFWATIKVKTINGEVQLQALVDRKKIVISESTIRRDLQLEDVKGSAIPTHLHHTPTIIKPSPSQPQRKQRPRKPKRNDTEIPHSSGLIEHVADKAVYKERDDSLERAATTATSLDAEQDRGCGPRRQNTMGDTIAQNGFENVSKTSNDSLLVRVNTPRSDEDSIKLKELMDFCTKLQQRVLDLDNTKTAQAQEITSLKLGVKKLEKKGESRTHKLKRLYKVGLS